MEKWKQCVMVGHLLVKQWPDLKIDASTKIIEVNTRPDRSVIYQPPEKIPSFYRFEEMTESKNVVAYEIQQHRLTLPDGNVIYAGYLEEQNVITLNFIDIAVAQEMREQMRHRS